MQPERDLERAVAAWLTTTPTAVAPAGLHDDAMATLRGRRQYPMGIAAVRTDVGTIRPVLRLVAVAAVVAAIVTASAVLVLSLGAKTRTDDLLGQRTSRDPVPFAYVIPTNSGLEQDPPGRGWVVGWSAGVTHPRARVDPADGTGPAWDAEQGIIVGAGPIWAHSDAGRYVLRPDPVGFLDDLRDRSGANVGPIEMTTVDDHPAAAADVQDVKSDLHYGSNTGGLAGNGHSLRFRSRLIVTNVDGRPIFIQIWARNHVALDAWIPTAMQFVDSMRFLDGPAPTPTPGSP